MARVRDHLSNAPLREALIDVAFDRPIAVDLVDRFAEVAGKTFTQTVDIYQASVAFDAEAASTQASQSILGKRLSSPDSKYVLQCRLDGLTVSRLSPYGEWADLRDEARKWWTVLNETCGFRSAARVAVRYINSLPLPLPFADFVEYLTCPPDVPRELPQAISGFLQRVIIPDPQSGSTAAVTQALEGFAPDQGKLNVLLDIEVFRPVPTNDPNLWDCLDQLRERKNQIFFAYLQEKAVEMFE